MEAWFIFGVRLLISWLVNVAQNFTNVSWHYFLQTTCIKSLNDRSQRTTLKTDNWFNRVIRLTIFEITVSELYFSFMLFMAGTEATYWFQNCFVKMNQQFKLMTLYVLLSALYHTEWQLNFSFYSRLQQHKWIELGLFPWLTTHDKILLIMKLWNLDLACPDWMPGSMCHMHQHGTLPCWEVKQLNACKRYQWTPGCCCIFRC